VRTVFQLPFVALLLLRPAGVSANVSSTELIEKGATYDGKQVEFIGEVIGDAMHRGDHLWVNVSDGSNSALGVWVARDAFPAIRHFGTYRARGDVLRIQGLFHRACAEHGGDMDLHAATIAVVRPGATTREEVDETSLILSGVLLLTSLVAFLLWRRREKAVRSPS
jgi:LPXTG-motif cell wall-anchored protein